MADPMPPARDRGDRPRLRRFADAFGLPALNGRGRLVLALGIDSLGSGFFLPFAFVYFLKTTDISLVGVGSALSLGALIAMPFSLPAGSVVDRRGPRAVMLTSHALRFGAFLCFPLAERWWQVLILTSAVGIGETSFWPANNTLVARIAPHDLSRWFGLERALRNGGIAVGGAAASVLVAQDSSAAPTVIALVNAATFAIAGVLIATFRHAAFDRSNVAGATSAEAMPRRAFLHVVRDLHFMAVVGSTVVIGLTDFVLILIVAATFGGSPSIAWLPGALLSLNALGVTLVQPPVAKATEKVARTRAIQVAAIIYCLSFAGLIGATRLSEPLLVASAFASVAVFTFAELLQAPAGYGLAASIAPDAVRGRYMAVYQLSWTVASVIGPAVFAFLLDIHRDLPLVALGAACVAMAVVMGWLHRALPPSVLVGGGQTE